jgi:hypothetical protein
MKTTIITSCLLGVAAFQICSLHGALPKSQYYPFAPTDLVAIRAITKAESIADSPDLTLAWDLYTKVQGSWKPGSEKPSKQVVSALDGLKDKLETAPKPQWILDHLISGSAPDPHVAFAESIGDATFVDQADSPAYQSQKALTIVYLAEHEIDRPEAADKAGTYLTLLSLKHPWDWQIHGLYSRLLTDAGLQEPSFREAVMSLYLNPQPKLEDLQFFAFIAATSKRDQFESIQQIIKETAVDAGTAELAIEHAAVYFKSKVKFQIVPPTQAAQ